MQMKWFMQALPEYDTIFSPRPANLDELRALGCRDVRYLPFGYDSDLFFPEPRGSQVEEGDLFFAGTADRDRVPYIRAAIAAQLDVRLHGIYWRRHRETRGIARGQADTPTLREAIASCMQSGAMSGAS